MEKSKFKGIHQILVNGKNLYWQMKLKVNGRNCSKCFNTEREADGADRRASGNAPQGQEQPSDDCKLAAPPGPDGEVRLAQGSAHSEYQPHRQHRLGPRNALQREP